MINDEIKLEDDIDSGQVEVGGFFLPYFQAKFQNEILKQNTGITLF